MKKHPILITSLLLLVALAVLVFYLTRPKPVEVVVATVEKGRVEATVANTRAGSVKACQRARLSPPAGGQIVKLTVHEGEPVKRGELLLELWNEDLRAQLVHARRSAEASKLKTAATCVRADEAKRKLRRLQPLHERGAVSDDQFDEARSSASALEAECKASRGADEVAEAQIKIVAASLERTRLYAPFDGTVAEINGELFEYVTPSPVGVATPPAIDLIDTGCFYVDAPIDETDAPKIQLQMPVRITLDAFGDRVFDGKIRRIANYVVDRERQARTVDIEVIPADQNDAKSWLAGYSADVEVITKTREDVLRIPSDALVDENQVYLFDPATASIHKRKVETGLSNWDFTEVTAGLEAGDQIVTSVDREGLADGVTARVESSQP